MERNETAIIIGAGPAGLTAAYRLLKETGIRPVILEETPYIGGISRTAQYKGNRIDLGGHRFFTKSPEVNRLWRELMPVQGAPALDDRILGVEKPWAEGGPDPEKEDRVFLLRNRVSRIFFLRKFFDYPISLKPATFINMGFWNTLRAGFGYIRAMLVKPEVKSLEDFYISRFGRPLYEMFFEDYTEKLWGIHPRNISPEFGAQRVKALSLSKAVLEMVAKAFNKKHQTKETSLIDQFMYPKKGPGQLFEAMAEDIRSMGGEIRLEARVTGVDKEGGRITGVRYAGKEGEESLTGDHFFSSMPVKDLVAAMGDEVPEEVREIAKDLPYRDYITVGLLCKKLLLKNQTAIPTLGGIVPDNWIYIQERDVKIGRLQIFNNWSPYMVEDPEHTVWIGLEYFCNEGDDLWEMGDEAFIAMARKELESMGIIAGEDVLDAVRIRVKKAYPAYFGSYERFGEVREHLDTYENLYCIGRNGQHRYNNMDHSMMTAWEAVDLLKSGSRDKSPVWKVNTEEDYHEEKK